MRLVNLTGPPSLELKLNIPPSPGWTADPPAGLNSVESRPLKLAEASLSQESSLEGEEDILWGVVDGGGVGAISGKGRASSCLG